MNVAILLNFWKFKNNSKYLSYACSILKILTITAFIFTQTITTVNAESQSASVEPISVEPIEIVIPATEITKSTHKPISAIPTKTWVVQVLLGLSVVVMFIFVLAKVAKKYNLGGLSKNNESIKLLSHLSVGIKERIAVIEVDNKQLLLGITPHSINTLHVFDLNRSANDSLPTSSNIKKIIVTESADPSTKTAQAKVGHSKTAYSKTNEDLFSPKNILRCAMAWVSKNKASSDKQSLKDIAYQTVSNASKESDSTKTALSFNNIYAFELNKNKDSSKE